MACIERFLRAGQRHRRRPGARAPPQRDLGILRLGRLQVALPRRETLELRRRVARCVSCSRARSPSACDEACLEFLAPGCGALFLFIELGALDARGAAAPRRASVSCSRRPGKLLAQLVAMAQGFSEAARVCSARTRVASSSAVGVALGGVGRILPGEIEAGRLELADLGGKRLVFRRLPGLALEARQLRLQLPDHVVEPRQILLRRLELELGLVPARVQAGDAGGFFEDEPARLRLGVDDLGDLALAHQGGRARAGRGVGEEQLHVAGAHVAAVDAIGRARLALDAAGDLELSRCR